MSARTMPAGKAKLHLTTDRFHNPYADYNAEVHDLFCHAMDCALGVQKASLAAVAKMQSDAIEMQKHAYEYVPQSGKLFGTVSKSFAFCMEMQVTWLNLMAVFAKEGFAGWFQFAALGAASAGDTVTPIRPAQGEAESISFMARAA